MTSSAVSEAPSSQPVGEVNQEGHTHESKPSESPTAIENGNAKISEYIENGLSPEQIDNRLESQLQNPEVQRELINEFSPYSEKINSCISTFKELQVYTKLDLKESVIGDRPCLLLKIDPNRTDAMGRNNVARTASGSAAIDENGDSVNLHHIGQKSDSPLAELPDRVHKENDSILHDKSKSTEVHGEGSNWNEVRPQYWRERSTTL